jgi:hypothetical protein
MNFDLEYKLQQFREAQSGYYDENGKRYSSTPINTGNAELMLDIINELESALVNVETELRQLTTEKICEHEYYNTYFVNEDHIPFEPDERKCIRCGKVDNDI